MGKMQDLTGQRFSKLTVLRDVGRLHGGVLWECRCDCGRIVNVRACNLKSGDSKTCGKRRQCHHAWEGGHKNKGSVAWAKKKITGMKIKAKQRGHAPVRCTPEEYLKAWEESNNCCKICGKAESDLTTGFLCVDHCHDTGKIRGILCNNCNSGIGMFNDDLELIEKAWMYVNSSKRAKHKVTA